MHSSAVHPQVTERNKEARQRKGWECRPRLQMVRVYVTHTTIGILGARKAIAVSSMYAVAVLQNIPCMPASQEGMRRHKGLGERSDYLSLQQNQRHA
jgi:hypothetical protein